MNHVRCWSLLLTIFCFLNLSAHSQERLYVVQFDEYLGQIDLVNGHINSRLLPLGAGCNDILVSGTRLYVTNSLQNTVQEIDATSNVTIREIPLDGAVNPYSSAMLNQDTLVVTNWVSDDLAFVSLSQGRVVRRQYVGDGPEGILVHGDYVFVCLTRYDTLGSYGQGVVMVLNRHNLQVTDSIRVGTNPQSVAIDIWGRLHVVCTGDYVTIPGRVDIVNAETLETDTVLAVGGTPGSVTFAGEFAILAAGGWGANGYVYRYRLRDLAILNDQSNPIATGAGAIDVVGLGDGTFLVSCFMTDEIEQRTPEGQLITRFPVSDGPGQMASYPLPQSSFDHRGTIPFSNTLIEAYPNPFNCSVRIRLNAPLESQTGLVVYNQFGQKVKFLQATYGATEIVWDGIDERGTKLPSGVFYLASNATVSSNSNRIVLIR